MADETKIKVKKFSISAPKELFDRIEKARKKTEGDISRSEYIVKKLQPAVPK